MLPYYAYHALNRFNTTLSIEPKFHETYSSDVLFNTDVGNMPRFDCRYNSFGPSGVRPHLSWRAPACYSPDKIQEGVINPQPYTIDDPTPKYKLYSQDNPDQVMKDAVGTDFFYNGAYEDMKGVRFSDNCKQLLDVLNAMRYTSSSFNFETNIKRYTRHRNQDNDTGWIVDDVFRVGSAYWYFNGYDGAFQEDEVYYTFDIDFYNDPNMSDAFKGLIENAWYYPSLESIYNGNKFDYEVIKVSHGQSVQLRCPSDLGIDRAYFRMGRYATSLKEMTMEDLANHYQVPY